MTMISLNVDNDLGHEIMKQVHKPQNALMHQKMQEQMIASVNPVITELIMEAISQGICQTEFPSEATEMILLYSNIAFDKLANLSDSERLVKIEGFIYDDGNLPSCVAFSGSWGYYNWNGLDLGANIKSIKKINYGEPVVY